MNYFQLALFSYFSFCASFGLAKVDDVNKLGALTQCCNIRLSTFEKLLEFDMGDTSVSSAMRKSMELDLIAPVLTEDYLAVSDSVKP